MIKCVLWYMVRKAWEEFYSELLPYLAITAVLVTIGVAVWWVAEKYPFAFSLLGVFWLGAAIWGLVLGIIQQAKADILKLYREARRECIGEVEIRSTHCGDDKDG